MKTLKEKIDFAIKLIQSAAAKAKEVGQPIEVCYSGGKDSDVILELVRMAKVEYRAIYKNTTIDPPGTIKHCRERGVEIIKPKYSFGQIIQKTGFPSRHRRICCAYLKEYKILNYAILGIRSEESNKRKERYKEPEQCRVFNKKEKTNQYFNDAYEWLFFSLHYDSIAEFNEFMKENIFGEKFDCKKYLSERFNVKFGDNEKKRDDRNGHN